MSRNEWGARDGSVAAEKLGYLIADGAGKLVPQEIRHAGLDRLDLLHSEACLLLELPE